MKLQAVQRGNTYLVTTPDGEPIEEIQSIADGYLPGLGLYLSVHVRIPLNEPKPIDKKETEERSLT